MKKNKLYDAFIDRCPLTKKELLDQGFTETELMDMILLTKITTRNDLYIPGNLEDFYQYGMELDDNCDYYHAQKCFKRCLEIDPNFYPALIRLASTMAYKKKYKNLLKYLAPLKDSDNPRYRSDYNFYLYLLSFTLNLSKEHTEYLSKLKKHDFIITGEKNDPKIALQNKMRMYVIGGQFYEALQVFREIKSNAREFSSEISLLENLFIPAKLNLQKRISTLESMIASSDYEGVSALLSKEIVIHYLRSSERYYLDIANDILMMRKTKEPIYQISNAYSDKTHQAIAKKQYEKAYLCNRSFAQDKNIPPQNDYLNMLLEAVLETKHTLMRKKAEDGEGPSFSNLKFFADSLYQGEYRASEDALEVYLESIGKGNYAYLIEAFIEVDIQRKETQFYRPLAILGDIICNSFVLKINRLTDEAERYIKEGRLDTAKLLLDMLIEATKRGHIGAADKTWYSRISHLNLSIASKCALASGTALTIERQSQTNAE